MPSKDRPDASRPAFSIMMDAIRNMDEDFRRFSELQKREQALEEEVRTLKSRIAKLESEMDKK